jgi:hypothetical protein
MATKRRAQPKGPLKKAVSERFAIALAEESAKAMYSASNSDCKSGMDRAVFAAIDYGKASMRLGDAHPALREAGNDMLKSFNKLVSRCAKPR